MFSLSHPGTEGGVLPLLVLPAGAGPALLPGQVIEDVAFVRDDMANIVWAVQKATPSPLGEARAGAERNAAVLGPPSTAPPPTPAAGAPALKYRLATPPPVHWSPLFPVRVPDDNPAIVLELGGVVRPAPGGTGTPSLVRPPGRILSPGALRGRDVPYRIREEEVAREGTRVQRLYNRSRAHDGTPFLWVARRRTVGAGEGNAGLRFDRAEPRG
jgi:hypothetical protein